MNVGHLGIVSSAAAMPTAQSRGNESDRVQQETAAHEFEVDSVAKAEAADGIGETHEDAAADDRDADGRRPWEIGPSEEAAAENESAPGTSVPRSKDPTGARGKQLDLSG